MKHIKILLGLSMMLGLACSAFAQFAGPVYAPQTLGAFSCAASAATNLNVVIDCRKQSTVTVQFTGTNTLAGAGAGAGSLYFAYVKSIDGQTYDNNITQFANVGTPNGTSTNCAVTNLVSAGVGYIKITYFTNASQASTNMGYGTLSYAVKIQAP